MVLVMCAVVEVRHGAIVRAGVTAERRNPGLADLGQAARFTTTAAVAVGDVLDRLHQTQRRLRMTSNTRQRAAKAVAGGGPMRALSASCLC